MHSYCIILVNNVNMYYNVKNLSENEDVNEDASGPFVFIFFSFKTVPVYVFKINSVAFLASHFA